MIKPAEKKLVGFSFIYFFCLLAGYFILRPIRDEMGIVNGASNMQWLFTGTFGTMLLIVPIFGHLTKKYDTRTVLMVSNSFFLLNILLFFVFFKINSTSGILATFYFIWLSVFNLFVVSLFWSFMSDIYSREQAKRLFGVIAAGGSLGAITGPLISTFIASRFAIENLFLAAFLCILISLYAIYRIISFKKGVGSNRKMNPLFEKALTKATILQDIARIFTSSYLMRIVLYVLLYTAVSTFLYFEQAHILEETIAQSAQRVIYFSKIDLATNGLSIFGQLVMTNRLIKLLGLACTLAFIPFLVGFGFFILNSKLTLTIIAITLVVHRAGNFSLLRPGREILFTATERGERYRAKNFIDTAIYRGGDALTGWLFAIFLSTGLGLSAIALIGIPITLAWSVTGYFLGKQYSKKERTLSKKSNYETQKIF